MFADGTESIFLAPMSGDGVDLVRIRAREVSYFPNCGNGRFGPKVTMENPPILDADGPFDPSRVVLAEFDGYGPTDLVYLSEGGAEVFLNQCGNSWSPPSHVAWRRSRATRRWPSWTSSRAGRRCLVWSSALPGDARRPLRYVDLMGGVKPHLLVGVDNNLGAQTLVTYKSSTQSYLEDERDGRPWRDVLPVAVPVISRVETIDRISRSRFVTRYAYHEGSWDRVEHDHGFGLVEQWDTEHLDDFLRTAPADATNVDEASHVPPTHTKTWYHSGAYLEGEEISRQLARQYYGAPRAGPGYEALFASFLDDLLPDTVIPEDVERRAAMREACRALKGQVLRQEVYAEDGSARAGLPYVIAESNYTIKLLQPRERNPHAVLLSLPRETDHPPHGAGPERPPRHPRRRAEDRRLRERRAVARHRLSPRAATPTGSPSRRGPTSSWS